MWGGFETRTLTGDGAEVFARVGGSGPPLLLLHGFPETHLMWRDIAPRLTERFTVVCADLRGYGSSGCPPSADDHAPYAKRAMAADLLAAMRALGFERFAVAGHDRGGRVAYRLALDSPDAVTRLAVMDVIPGKPAWDLADARFAMSFWPWTLLAQPAPLPETLLSAAPEAAVADAVSAWDTPADAFPPEVQAAYAAQFRDPTRVHAICEEYRAGAKLDRDHDAADQAAGRRIACPTSVLWSAKGGLDSWYDAQGGPLGIWREWADDVSGRAIEGGHFFPEEKPAEVAETLAAFFAA